ncbi:hypothetical protein AALP_AAs55461U000100 [Arabis alpina]|uniref:Uncharacterized protein n=1 Tax=Arabis alpina TaxID=50452 RepID=A0A087G114_ARAAL|nr:hypothetical protein AALP_AAs55461U000100 [Arabis alpina]
MVNLQRNDMYKMVNLLAGLVLRPSLDLVTNKTPNVMVVSPTSRHNHSSGGHNHSAPGRASQSTSTVYKFRKGSCEK